MLRWSEAVHAAWKAKQARAYAAEAGGAPARAPVAQRPYPVVHLCEALGLPMPIPEYQFHPARRWRFDYAWPAHKLALEIEGGIWTHGRHTRGKGALADLEKYSEAAILGWRILYCTPDDVATLGIERVAKAMGVGR